ncbi:hypothetical protein V5O48_013223 [Marasmius crinis-equi]|uniref:F-box domain-containing protein n=1 Tax=Marasmius crinis-equi TaxID=585013 RepID=A0ABR3F0P3_9AGAR
MPAFTSVERLPTLLCDQCNAQFIVQPCHPDIPMDSFRHNTFPSDTEIALQLAYIEGERFELERYDKEIARLQSTAQKLQNDRVLIQEQINRRRYFISSQRKLPVEIWTRILLEACYEKEFYRSSAAQDFSLQRDPISYPISLSPSNSRLHRIPPLSLSKTCYRWKGIIFGIRDFWSCAKLGISHAFPSTLKSLETFFERSRGSPLTMKLYSTESLERNPDASRDTLAVVRRNLSRVQSLDIDQYALSQLLRYGELSMPRLRRLLTGRHGIVSNTTQSLQVGSLIIAPSLASVSVDTLHPFIEQSLLQTPLRLTSFECWRLIRTSQLPLLTAAYPHLKTLKICAAEDRAGSSRSDIWGPSTLEHLDIAFPPNLTSPVMNSMTIPSLRSLDLRLPEWVDAQEALECIILPLIAFLRRSGCKLESLGFFSYVGLPVADNPSWLAEIFSLTPGLKNLHFTTSTYVRGSGLHPPFSGFVSVLTLAGDSECVLLPDLHTVVVRVEWYNGDHAPDVVNMAQEFLSMMESRRRNMLKRGELIFSCSRSGPYRWKNIWKDLDSGLDFTRRKDVLFQQGVVCIIKCIEN